MLSRIEVILNGYGVLLQTSQIKILPSTHGRLHRRSRLPTNGRDLANRCMLHMSYVPSRKGVG